MNHRLFSIVIPLSALMAAGLTLAPERASAQQQGVEELTRGPIHEAFAASVSYNPEPGIFVDSAPPGMIEELPPEQRMEGDNVAWVPGYWAWDEESNDFIWISGIWRNLPPGRQWVPGYWGEDGSRWQWTSGYWGGEETQEVTYLPAPPKSIESGPNIAAPSNNTIWISGNWTHRENRYAWTPGYWEPAQQDWIWIPAHYQWTRRGYVFVGGYWDYNVARRGMIFAPVRFRGDYYRQPGYSYTPLVVISLNIFQSHLFVRPNYGHYYFGDYYSPRYRDNGYYSSRSYFSGRRGYDPFYAHSRWEHRDDRDWDRNRRDDFDYYRDHEDARPAHTWAAFRDSSAIKGKDKRGNQVFAQPLSRYVEQGDSGQKFQSVSKKSRDKYVEQRKDIQKFSQERRTIESRAPEQKAEGSDKRGKVSQEKFAKSPLMGKRAEQLSGRDAPPKRLSQSDSQRQVREDVGKRADQSRKADKPGKTAADVREGPDRTPTPDRQRGKDPKADVPRSETQADSGKSRKAEAAPSWKAESSNPTPDRATKPEKNTQPQSKRETAPSERQKRESAPASRSESQPKREATREMAKPEPQRQAKPEPQRQAKPEPQRQAKPEPQRQAKPEPQRQAKPERRPAPKPEAARAPSQTRQSSGKSSSQPEFSEDSSNKESKGRKR